MKKRTWGALGASVVPVCGLTLMAMPGFAQEAERSSASTALEEVVVTAQKREERLQDVPVSVSVIDTEQLARQNITSVAELTRAVPALNGGGVTGGIAIRGVSTNGFARSSEGAVSVVLDGVATGRTQIANIFDIERVEVLSGPQGMLFGKNASAGVINIVTKAPDPSDFAVIAHIDYGNYDYEREQLTVNAPLGSSAAMRVGLHHDTQSGVTKNVLRDSETQPRHYGGRMRLLWDATDALTFNLIGDWDKTEGTGDPTGVFAIAGTPALASRIEACGIVASLKNTKNCAEGVNSVISDTLRYGGSLQVDYTLPGDYVLTSITAKRWVEAGDFDYTGLGGDTDLLPGDLLSTNLAPTDIDTFSQELRLTSPLGQFIEFVGGLYYYEQTSKDLVVQGGTLGLLPFRIGNATYIDVEQQSYAAFGQATINVTDQFALIVGGRYDDEKLTDRTSQRPRSDYGFVAAFPPGSVFTAIDEEVKSDNFSWKLGAQYNWSPDLMTYFTATRGYKGPAINDQGTTANIIEAEIPMSYELGLKSTILNGAAIATVALFHNKIEDFQTAVFVPGSATNPVPGFGQGNAPYIKVKGVEANLIGRPTDSLTLNGGFIYNDAEYSPDFLVACNPEQVRGVGTCSALGTTKPVDQLANVPELRVLLGGEFATQLTDNITGFAQADFVYESDIDLSPTPNPITRIDDRYLLGGRIGIRSPDDKWGVSIFGRNLLDKQYPTMFADPLSQFNGGGGRSYWTFPSIDWYRTYGVTIDARF